MKIPSLMLALILTAPAALAQQPDCRLDGNQLEVNQCAADDIDKADAELNATYAQVQAALAGRSTALLRLKAAQRLWIQLRDADLAALFPLEDGQDARTQYGSIYLFEYADARSEMTRQRTAYLRARFLSPARLGR